MDQSALLILTKIHIPTKLEFLSFSPITFLLLILMNYVRDESFREILAPTSSSGSHIIYAALYSAHRCTFQAF